MLRDPCGKNWLELHISFTIDYIQTPVIEYFGRDTTICQGNKIHLCCVRRRMVSKDKRKLFLYDFASLASRYNFIFDCYKNILFPTMFQSFFQVYNLNFVIEFRKFTYFCQTDFSGSICEINR